MVLADGIILLGFSLVCVFAIRSINRSRRPPVPPDLRRADDAEQQAPYDHDQATQAAEEMFWRGMGP
jgi:hypothetical protein